MHGFGTRQSAALTRRATLGGLTGVAVAWRADAQKPGGDFVLVQPQPSPSMDAMMASQQPVRNITLHVYETLFARSEKGVAIPVSPSAWRSRRTRSDSYSPCAAE